MNIPALYLSLFLALFLTLLSDNKAGVLGVDLLGYPCRDPDSTFTQSVLDTHNLYRASHNDTSPLCLSQKLVVFCFLIFFLYLLSVFLSLTHQPDSYLRMSPFQREFSSFSAAAMCLTS